MRSRAFVTAEKQPLSSMSADKRVCAPNLLALLYRTTSLGSANNFNRLLVDCPCGCLSYGDLTQKQPSRQVLGAFVRSAFSSAISFETPRPRPWQTKLGNESGSGRRV